jgi:hypothetical protein
MSRLAVWAFGPIELRDIVQKDGIGQVELVIATAGAAGTVSSVFFSLSS